MSKRDHSAMILGCSTDADAQTLTTCSISESQLPQLSIQEQPDDENSPGKTPTRVKWNDKENRLLVEAWLNISKDSITEVGQKNEGYYQRFQSYYNENCSRDMKKRTWRVIKDRWRRVKRAVQKFAECYARAAQQQQSGCSEADIIQVAGELYRSEVGKKFVCVQTWRLLKDEPKWQAELREGFSSKRTKVSASGTYTSSSNAEMEAPTPTSPEFDRSSPPFERQMGKEVAKRKEKARATETSSELSSEEFNLMQETAERKLVALEQLARAKEEEARAKQRQIDIDVVFRDTSSMTEEQLEIHKMMCEQIKEKLKKM